ncbi:sensor histidine kinase [Mariniluteicoccus flavus]
MALSRRMYVLLDILVGVLAVVNALSGIASHLPVGGSEFLAGAGVVGSLGVLACWAGWRLTGNRAFLLAFMGASVVAAWGGGGALPLLLMVLGVSLVVASHGLLFGVVGLLLFTLSGVVVMAAWHKEPLTILLDSLAGLLLAGLGLVLGLGLRELADERRANLRLVEELRATHQIEKELMLSDERARSARELHDGLGHRLTLIGMSLDYAGRMRESHPDKAYAEVEHARDQALEALTHMRRWVRALNPPRDSALTGIAAFEAIAESFRGTGLDVRVHQTGQEHELSREASLFAYRLVQEGLTNVLRHSDADEVDITVHWRDGGVEVELADNGGVRGSRPPADVEAGFGLRSLAERAAELGGAFAARTDERGVVLTGSVREAS